MLNKSIGAYKYGSLPAIREREKIMLLDRFVQVWQASINILQNHDFSVPNICTRVISGKVSKT